MRLEVTFAAGAILALLASAALAEEAIGTVKRSHGQVVIERGEERIVPRAGTVLQRGDRLLTGPNGYVTVSMSRAASLSVGANSAVPLDRYAFDPDTTVSKPAPGILQSLASFLAVNRQR